MTRLGTQLDAIYGDPRFVADAIVHDLTKFRPLKDGEDSRFCDLVHLVRPQLHYFEGSRKRTGHQQ